MENWRSILVVCLWVGAVLGSPAAELEPLNVEIIL